MQLRKCYIYYYYNKLKTDLSFRALKLKLVLDLCTNILTMTLIHLSNYSKALSVHNCKTSNATLY